MVQAFFHLFCWAIYPNLVIKMRDGDAETEMFTNEFRKAMHQAVVDVFKEAAKNSEIFWWYLLSKAIFSAFKLILSSIFGLQNDLEYHGQ